MLPLGIDMGATRIRIAACEADASGEVRLKAVAARDLPSACSDDPAIFGALVDEMRDELAVRERRCIASLGARDASLRVVAFPKMTWGERIRASRFEANRATTPSEGEEARTVRVHPCDREAGTYAVGIALGPALTRALRHLRSARLRVIAIDWDGWALRRVIDFADAILDIGSDRSTLHLCGRSHASFEIERGGACVTQAIAGALGIDEATAERRKRILGTAGTGTAPRAILVQALVTAIEIAREREAIARIALVGNGARLPGIAEDIENASGAHALVGVPPLLESGSYPDDVVRRAAPDWTLAAALATWSIAR